ncbi:shikimate kinase [Geobacter sp. AOG2]|uniref:shikimate kinase n=1 Tax=Geobacter sp. AOG2 TaxID=1566347 RepID=UPI001CC418D0|nr:shikimate kinase [Geobacter sp. AOG2]GFE59787.1 shikimate kinase [Geobacter sp. AOG2]
MRAPERPCAASNIVLIGMPGAGKSTIGVILAKLASLDFIDTDVLIQSCERRSLQSIIDSQGYMALREIEERILLDLECRDHVIATGGSAVYSRAAMAHLAENGVVVFLDVDLATLESRALDLGRRGVAKHPGQSFAELFEERHRLYVAYADVTVDCRGRTHEMVCTEILGRL